ncbi:MAG TPA: substrate-binding domain-containing protein [Segetibacter sp.]|jgi:LacI family transcriptional regulator
MKKKTSIHDIARELKISAATISFVLNGKAEEKRISEEMTKKILAHVKKIGYQPNPFAKGLRTGKSNIIGMMVENISDPFFAGIARGVEKNAYTFGYKIFYVSTENDLEKSKALLNVFRERQVDGYIIAPPPGMEREVQQLIDDNVPVILFDRYYPDVATTNVVIDNYKSAYMAAEHLNNNNYKNVGFVTLDSDQTQMAERLRGYLDAMNKEEHEQTILKVPYNISHDEVVQRIKDFISSSPHLDAIFFATNHLTTKGLEAIKLLNISVPDTLGIISFDDNTHFSLFTPSISAVAQPMTQIAEEVVRLLMKRLANNDLKTTTERVVLPTELVVRNSSVPKKSKKIKKVLL